VEASEMVDALYPENGKVHAISISRAYTPSTKLVIIFIKVAVDTRCPQKEIWAVA